MQLAVQCPGGGELPLSLCPGVGNRTGVPRGGW